jgi:hypothetical protein
LAFFALAAGSIPSLLLNEASVDGGIVDVFGFVDIS